MSVVLAPSHPEDPDGVDPTFYFGSGGLPVRAKIINGEPWFVAADLAVCLGLGRAQDALSVLPSGDQRRDLITGPDNSDLLVDMVSESGLYSMIMRSDKPQARAFQRWVTREVLPSIRKTGQYAAVPRTFAQALRAAADAEDARERAELESAQAWAEATRVRAIADDQHEQIQRDAPKVGFVENFVEPAEDTCTVGMLAKELGVGERKLRDYLISRRRIYKDRNGMYQPYAYWVKWFTLKDHPEVKRLYNDQVRTTLYVLPVGKEGIRLMLKGDPGGLYG